MSDLLKRLRSLIQPLSAQEKLKIVLEDSNSFSAEIANDELSKGTSPFSKEISHSQDNGKKVVHTTSSRETFTPHPSGEKGLWTAKESSRVYRLEKDGSGRVVRMTDVNDEE